MVNSRQRGSLLCCQETVQNGVQNDSWLRVPVVFLWRCVHWSCGLCLGPRYFDSSNPVVNWFEDFAQIWARFCHQDLQVTNLTLLEEITMWLPVTLFNFKSSTVCWVYVCLHFYKKYLFLCKRAQEHRGQRLIFSVFLNCSLPFFNRQCLSKTGAHQFR